ncbi:MAG TPA: BACON domain-containing carbohydrate-binding protein [Bryobacteraceae bacterium]|nr:BACON domain-containing carbohydrate-binding protein [Bryobacteraceae bacterium]
MSSWLCGFLMFCCRWIGKQPIYLAVALVLGSTLSMAQVLNMSHDLQILGIADQNLAPNNPSLDARPLFQAALQYVQNHPVQTLTLDPGSYYLLTPQQSNAVLVFPKLSNLTIDLAGSTFYFNTPLLSTGFLLYFCSNLTFRNFQTDYITPPYTHVQITSVDTAGRIIHYQSLPGWPDPSTFNNLVDPYGGAVQFWAALFRKGQLIQGTSRTALVPPFTNSTLVLQQDFTPWTQAATLSTLQPGDTAVVSARAGGSIVDIWQGDSVTLSNVKIYGSNGFAVDVYESSNTLADHVSVMPRPGTGLVGSNADGIHFSSTYQNNHIRNCYVTRTEDDALIMDSQIQAVVMVASGPQQLTVQRTAFNRFPNGTPVNFVDPASTTELTGATIVSQSPPDSESPGFGENVVLTFDRPLPALPAGAFMVYGSAALRGSGGTFEDNLVEDIISGKGLWINGVMNVTAQRNVIRRMSESGISISQDTEAFPAPPVHNITVTDNVLEAGEGVYGEGTGVQDSLGAIQVVSTNNQNFGFADASSNSAVTIQNNYIADSGRSGIWVGELNGGVLQNNLVIRSNQNPALGGVFGIPPPFQNQVRQDALTPVVIRYSALVAETADVVSAASDITAPVTMSPASATISAAATAGTFGLQTAVPGFAWRAFSDSAWLTVAAGITGAGTGTVQYTAAANLSGAARTAHITIAGEVFTVTQTTLTGPILRITKTHTGNFTLGQDGATYVVTVSNQAGAAPTSGQVTVTETIPQGLTLVSMAGNGWNCSATICSRSESLASGASYPPITVTVNVALAASAQVTNQASVSGAGSASASVSDPTAIVPAVQLPAIQAIADSWDYTAGLAPGAWVTIAGTNLVSGPPQTWNLAGLQQLPTMIGGVSVLFNEAPAALAYVSSTQINALVPASVRPGAVQVVVQVNGVDGAPFTITATGTLPSVYALPASGGGAFFVTAALAGTGTLIGDRAVDARVARAAQPGDVLDLYMIGLGATTDPTGFITDRVFAGAYPVSAGVTASVGGEPAQVLFAGLTSPGLYLVRVVIPADLSPGPKSIQIMADSSRTSSSLMLLVSAP